MRSVVSQFVKENNDSDQSISEEEDANGDWSENWISLGNPVEKEGDLQVLSQLDVLGDAQHIGSAIKPINSSPKKQNDFCYEDEIEFPAFDNGDDSVNIPKMASAYISNGEIISFPKAASLSILDEEIISDDDRVSFPTSGSIKRYEAGGTWTEAGREAEPLVYSSEKPGCSSSYCTYPKLNKSSKGSQGKHKLSSSFCSLSHKEEVHLLPKEKNEISALLVVQPADELNSTMQNHWDKPIVELLEDNTVKVEQSENSEVPVDALVPHGNIEHSMAEFLDCFQERSSLPQSNLKMDSRTKRRSRSLVHKRSISSFGDRIMDNDFVIEASDSGQSSGDEEHLLQDDPQKSIVPEKTMADQFQEVIGAAYLNDGAQIALPRPRQLGTGLFGKLQCVMQNEKEMEMLFLRRSHADDCLKGDSPCIDVKILSRSLEAKLTVCCCALVGDDESFHWRSRRTSTIIFSSKTCNDVELEVGNLIRIHPPWKDVRVKGCDDVIILSTYFSQI